MLSNVSFLFKDWGNMSLSVRKLAVVTAGSGLAVAPFSALSTSASANGYDCGDSTPAATIAGDGVCVVKFFEDGPHTFTAPTDLDAVSAVLVGAGGGSIASLDQTSGVLAYGGGGGEVVIVDTVDVSSPLSIVVGNGGLYDADEPSNSADGGDTTINTDAYVARGGKTATPSGGGASGNLNEGRSNQIYDATQDYFVGGGGGSGAAAPEDNSNTYPGPTGQGGEGTLVSSEPLFAWNAQAEEYDQILGEGGTVSTDSFDWVINGAPGEPGGIPGHGGNVFGFSRTSVEINMWGSDGAVFLAWYADESGGDGSYGDDALPETGTNIQPWTIAGGLVALLAGAVALTRRRERI